MGKNKFKISEANRETLRKIVKEVLKALRELEEATTTGGVAGYNTPAAFSGEGDKEKKKDRLVDDEYEYIDDLEEEIEEAIKLSENRWLELKKDDSRTSNRKIADGTSKARKDLIEIKKYLEWCSRIRNENDITKDKFHRRTERNIKKMSKLVDEIRMKLKEFKL